MSAIDRKLLLREMAGHLTTYALLRCAVSVDSAAWAWLNTQYNLYFSSAVARTRLEISDLACIVAKVDRYSVAIGNNQTTSPGEDHQIDPFVGNKLLFNKLSIGKVC